MDKAQKASSVMEKVAAARKADPKPTLVGKDTKLGELVWCPLCGRTALNTYKIIAALIHGDSGAAIAKAFGCSRAWVSQVYKQCVEAGILDDRE